MATLTVYSSAVDGFVRNAATGSTDGAWTTLIGAATGSYVDGTGTLGQVMVAGDTTFADGKQYCDRAFLAFDTSSLPDDAIIISVTLNLRGNSVGSTSAGGSVNVYESTVSSTSTLATADFDLVGSTEYATAIDFTSLSGSAYNTWTFNSTGRAAVNVSGYTKVSLRASQDTGGTRPTGSNWSHFEFRTSEYTGTGSDPYLTIEYTTPSTFTADMVVSALGAGDTFTDSNGVTLASHTPTGGYLSSSWAKDSASVLACEIQSNRVASAAVGDALYVNSVLPPPSGSHSISADVTVVTSGSSHAGVLGRWTQGSTTGYYAFLDNGAFSAAGYLRLYRYGGSGTAELGSYNVGTLSGTYRVRLDVVGTTVSVYLDGTQRISVTESSIASGFPGVRAGNGAGVASTQGLALDNWTVEAVPSSTSSTFTADMVVLATSTTTFTADMVVVAETRTKTFTADMVVSRNLTGNTAVFSGSVSTIAAGSGATDSLNYNAFPGLEYAAGPHTASGAAVDITAGKFAATFIGFNGACRCANGDLLVVGGYDGTDSSGPRYTGFLRCPSGSDPAVLANWTAEGAKSWTGNPTSTDGYDCWALSTMSADYAHPGRIYCTALNYSGGLLHSWLAYSDDHGATFSTPVAHDQLCSDLLGAVGTQPEYRPWYGPILETTDGTGDLITVVCRLRDVNVGPAAGTGMYAIETYCIRSTDDGATWGSTVLVADSTTDAALYGSTYANYDEPLLVRLANGRLACFMRSQLYPRGSSTAERWTVAYSSDEGATWTRPYECMQECGGHPIVIAAPNGSLVACYRDHSSTGTSVSGPTWMATSLDDGRTWGGRVRVGAASGELSSYGQMVVLDPTGTQTNDVACFFGTESTTTGAGRGVWLQKFAQATPNLVTSYHHANNHIGSGTNKLTVKRGTALSSMSEISGSPLRTTSGTNLADAWNITLASGKVLTGWNESTTPGTASISTVTTLKILSSPDGGATFPTTVYSSSMPGFASNGSGSAGAYGIAPCPPIQLATGRLLLPVYGYDDKTSLTGGYVKVFYSDDDGATWTYLSSPFPILAGTDYDETALLLLDTGEILACARTFTYGGASIGQDIYCNRSTDNGASWGTRYRVLGNGTSTGFGGRPSLIQTLNGAVLLTTRYMNAGVSSWSCVHLSTDRGLTFGTQMDPYDGTVGRTGAYSGTGRGAYVYAAFAATGDNTAALVWAEELGSDTSAVLYGREISVATSTSFTADMVVVTGTAVTFTQTFTADMVVYDPVKTATFTADMVVLAAGSAVFTSDMVIAGSVIAVPGTVTFTADLVVDTETNRVSRAATWFRRRRRDMSNQVKSAFVVLPDGTTRTSTYTSPTFEADTEAGVLVSLNVTAASGTGGLQVRINSVDVASGQVFALNAAPTAVTSTGLTVYSLYPFGGVSGNITQSTSGYLPRKFSITVTHGDSSSYTYSLGFCLLP